MPGIVNHRPRIGHGVSPRQFTFSRGKNVLHTRDTPIELAFRGILHVLVLYKEIVKLRKVVEAEAEFNDERQELLDALLVAIS